MLEPWSAILYLVKNKRKVVPIILILALSILGSTAIATITNSFFRDVERQSSLYQVFDTIYYNPLETKNISQSELDKKLSQISNLDGVFKGNWRNIKGTTIFGGYPFFVYFISSEDQQDFISSMGWKLLDGRLPEPKKPEIVMTNMLMLNKGIKLGDEVGTEIDQNDYLRGRYKVVGVLEENNRPGALGDLTYINNGNLEFSNVVYYLKAKPGSEDELAKKLNELKANYPSLVIDTRSSVARLNSSNFAAIRQITDVIVIIVILVISISVALLNIIFFMQRANEFGLLAALGFSRRFILFKTLKESFLQVVFGWSMGICIAQITYMLINQFIYYPKGIQPLSIFELRSFMFSLITPLMVLVFSSGTVFLQISRMNPIAIIERRD
jgi:ABC-type antimicrobial peptide transport system permease subunit